MEDDKFNVLLKELQEIKKLIREDLDLDKKDLDLDISEYKLEHDIESEEKTIEGETRTIEDETKAIENEARIIEEEERKIEKRTASMASDLTGMRYVSLDVWKRMIWEGCDARKSAVGAKEIMYNCAITGGPCRFELCPKNIDKKC